MFYRIIYLPKKKNISLQSKGFILERADVLDYIPHLKEGNIFTNKWIYLRAVDALDYIPP